MATKQIDLEGNSLLPVLKFGCLELQGADQLALSDLYASASKSECTLTLHGEFQSPWTGHTHVALRMFSMPHGKSEFRRVIEWFSEGRKSRARLPDGVRFEETTLALKGIPAGWSHEAFPRSSRDFIHIYRSDKLGVLIRLLAKNGPLLTNPLLKHIHENLRFVPKSWVTTIPVVKSRELRTSQDRTIGARQKAEIRVRAERARDSLGLKRVRDPRKIAAAVHKAIDTSRALKTKKEAQESLALDLGMLWGEALVAAAEWDWRMITVDKNVALGLCNQNRTFMVDPIDLVSRLLSSRRTPNNCQLLFEMILADDMPESSEYSYIPLG